ncbi:trans-aconitate 2-methyltransferase [Lyngbya sp. CCAP 1446/10]|uniref:class I SAM-dependent methyltransferase n=1 Tax=Lyngbya sp. CCAP 1446/10 TaxID=439293 RepID=UPI00223778DC|nr:class I SAM-dependent methyltransferase [Lyngbya sp. CCAP 1446/10]
MTEASQTKLGVFDLGCGNGSLSHLIAEHGCEVVGVDTSAPGIAISRQSFPSVSLSKQIFTNSPIPICRTDLMLSYTNLM